MSYLSDCLHLMHVSLGRIGTEHEKFGFEFGTLRPMKYEQIRDLLNGLAERFDWDRIMEGDYVIGLKQVNELSYYIVDQMLLAVILIYQAVFMQ